METVSLTSYDEVLDALRHRSLRQALYDEGRALMNDVVVNLHGSEHRDRRRMENRLFRRDVFMYYEREVLEQTMEAALKPFVAEGRADLLSLGRRSMMNLGARIAGIDLPEGSKAEFDRFYELMNTLSRASTVIHSNEPKDVVIRAGNEALDAFDREFLQPSLDRRRALLAAHAAGDLAEEDLPKDVCMLLVRQKDVLGLTDAVVLREIAYFPWVASHSTSHAFVHATHEVFTWLATHPEDRDALRADPFLLQRFVHEALRLHPASPEARRIALDEVVLRSGRTIPRDSVVVCSLVQANRDPKVFGDDAAEFSPMRELPKDVHLWGVTFGSGPHACMGQELAGGVGIVEPVDADEHLFGTIVAMIRLLLENGARPDPEHPPVPDAATKRPNYASYPVTFES